MNIVYRNEIYFLVDLDYTRPGFVHNFLLFVNDNEVRKAYSVQMAVNYISTLPTASFDQTVDEQTFIACIPLSEYPEVREYLENGCKPLNLLELTDNHAKRLIDYITRLLNGYKDVTDKQLNTRCEKLSQFTMLLDLNKISHPQSVYTFDELYHTYLNKQRVFKYSLKHKIQVTKLKGEIEYLLRQPILQLNERPRLHQFVNDLIQLKEEIIKFNYSWYDSFKVSADELITRATNKLSN